MDIKEYFLREVEEFKIVTDEDLCDVNIIKGNLEDYARIESIETGLVDRVKKAGLDVSYINFDYMGYDWSQEGMIFEFTFEGETYTGKYTG